MKYIYVLGPAGSFSHYAVNVLMGGKKKYLPESAQVKFASSFDELFAKVRDGRCALVPVWNKTTGDIAEVKKYLNKMNLKKLLELEVPIKFILAANEKISLKEVKRIFLNKIILKQCEKFIAHNLKNAKLNLKFSSTASAFQKIIQLRGNLAKNTVVIGSQFAAKMYGLKIIRRNIQDLGDNFTRFFLIQNSGDTNKNR